MNKTKKCSKCMSSKEASEFYICSGRQRPECKACTKRHNIRYQRENRDWLTRDVDPEAQKAYRKQYYARNKQKFKAYRKQFSDTHQGYFKEYLQKKKNQPYKVVGPQKKPPE